MNLRDHLYSREHEFLERAGGPKGAPNGHAQPSAEQAANGQSNGHDHGANGHDDHDHDSMGDRWERRYGLDTSRDDSMEDPDGDGLNNLTEYRMRTHPLEAAGYWTIERQCGCAAAQATRLAGWTVSLLTLVLFRRRGSTSPRRLAPRGQ